jgi:hypothetical protein
MNDRIRQIADEAAKYSATMFLPTGENGDDLFIEKFAMLIVEECRNVLTDVYREVPLECSGHLLYADEVIAKHFYGEKE